MSLQHEVVQKSRAIIRFAGDSGDGIQLMGHLWVKTVAEDRSDLSTAPDFPAEIRAPAGSLAGVSGFQIQFGSLPVLTAGDLADVLIALNPAALKTNLKDLKPGGLIIVNGAAFTEIALTKAGYETNPLTDSKLADYQILSIDMNGILRRALSTSSLSTRDQQKCKNFFCLGLLFWLYSRDITRELRSIEEKFKNNPDLQQANIVAFRAGFAYGENTESILGQESIGEADLEHGRYRTITGNKALALGLVTAGQKANIPLFYASYPITPASDILHELSALPAHFAHTFQMEDEMAAIGAAIGASFAGHLAVTATSGPGFALKAEALGYAVMVELPLVVIDVQRAGPSTGMPTKTEQADLLQAIYGRSGEAPLPVLAAMNPTDCFSVAIDAARIAIDFMTPVVILSDAFNANSSAPWRIVDPDDIEPITPKNLPLSQPLKIYERHKETKSRAWILPGTKDTPYQIGGLEKNVAGKVSYDPDNHQSMCDNRLEKINSIAQFVPPPTIFGQSTGDILLVGFGGTFGALRQACIDLKHEGFSVSHLHLRLLNPLHDEIGAMLLGFSHVVVAEHNQGQLSKLLRAKFLCDVQEFKKIAGKPFLVSEIINHVKTFFRSKPERSMHHEVSA